MFPKRAFLLGVKILAIAFVLFHLYTAAIGMLLPLQQRPIHVAFALVLTFALVSAKGSGGESRTSMSVWDIVLIVLTIGSAGYILANATKLMKYIPFATVGEAALAIVMILLILEAGRRRIGLTFPILTTIALLYAILGHHIPGSWGHSPISLMHVLENLYLGDVGIWGMLTGISSTLVALFIIFGALMLFTEGGKTFIDLAGPLTGRMWGGAAKISVLASAFFGTISGSAVANSAAVGNFTIPLMKKLGYKAEYAAAVEAVASTGGIFTPPVMGASAFILAALAGVSYVTVMVAAIIPSFLFFFGVFFSVDAYARKTHLAPVPPEMISPLRSVLTWPRLAPIVVPVGVLVGLLMAGFSAATSAFWGCAVSLVMYILATPPFSAIGERLKKTLEGLEAGGRSLASIVPLLVCASIVVALINLTGIGIKLSELVFSLGRDNLLVALLLGALVALFLGMGLPVAAAYVLCAAVMVPGFQKLGIQPLSAHFFLLYFACLSGITPPVCPNVFVTSAIAQSNWVKTAWRAVRLAFIIYVIPFVFVLDPALLMQGSPIHILTSFATALLATWLFVLAIEGFFLTKIGVILRLVLFACGALLLMRQFLAIMGGAVLAVLVILFVVRQWRIRQRAGLDLTN